jgi:hypothetical protein
VRPQIGGAAVFENTPMAMGRIQNRTGSVRLDELSQQSNTFFFLVDHDGGFDPTEFTNRHQVNLRTLNAGADQAIQNCREEQEEDRLIEEAVNRGSVNP